MNLAQAKARTELGEEDGAMAPKIFQKSPYTFCKFIPLFIWPLQIFLYFFKVYFLALSLTKCDTIGTCMPKSHFTLPCAWSENFELHNCSLLEDFLKGMHAFGARYQVRGKCIRRKVNEKSTFRVDCF